MESRRRQLHLADRSRTFDHPGLALARYVREAGNDYEAAKQVHDAMAESAANSTYVDAYHRWHRLHSGRPHCALHSGTLASPMALGLGNETVTEVGLTTHHTYGMPVIPGSAVKGVCRRGAKYLMDQDKLKIEEFNVLFGDTNSASYFVFWDAWYVPESVGGRPFHRDTITVHHPEYYRHSGKGNRWPTDFDDPNPVPFIVVKPGAQFLFGVDAPTEWKTFIIQLLEWSLTHIGVGGKTNAGYGFFLSDRGVASTPAPTGADAPPKPLPQPSGEEWVGVTLTYNAGKQELGAVNGKLKATISGQQSQKIRESLGAKDEELKKRKSLANVTVRVEPIGNGWRIVEVIVP